ncbi:hypothetical protein P280DRAFT_515876 [Massarina eburnea CBS 473.64]|uniref:DUF6535 domain-containing protein n=1 Tax=Massarina eburnea CBS 473.64 TaxID=1395130 RepID=A0A6A6S749_9PLEO|nr:hypothetical protein P280DRAFT_515876 [Massarina eburnea CBS 473.64]
MADAVAREFNNRTSWAYLVQILIGIITAPYRRTFQLYTWLPLSKLRAAGSDRAVLIPLVQDFKVDKYTELQSVQVAASFCAAATLSTIPWTKNDNTIWVAEALWLSSLSCSIWAVITSIQTKSLLDDLPNKDQLNPALPFSEVQRMQRSVLRFKKRPGVSHWIMVFIWQFPSMTMSYAWTTFIAGLTVHVCNTFIWHETWGTRQKIAIVYLGVGGVGLITYILSSVFVYVGEKDFEKSVASTRTSTNEVNVASRKEEDPPPDLVQLTRAKSMPSRDPASALHETRQDLGRSGRSKRQLLI